MSYSFTTRYDGNWGLGDPNASWHYGDLDGVNAGELPELAKTGVMTVTGGAANPVDLLLTEFAVTPTAGEFIEIFNPTGTPVDLSNVYLTDATYASGSTYYYKIVTGEAEPVEAAMAIFTLVSLMVPPSTPANTRRLP